MYGKTEGGTGKDALKFLISLFVIIAFVLVLIFGPPIIFGGVQSADYMIFMVGKTYEWLNAPEGATSQILLGPTDSTDSSTIILENMIANLPADIEKLPLNDTSISMSGGIAYLSCSSNISGDFKDDQFLYSHKPDFGVLLVVQKPGYLSANVTIPNLLNQPAIVVAIMVKDNNR
jgi:hypothetical protein